MVRAKKFVLVKHFENLPKESDLEIQEEELPDVKDGGEILLIFFFRLDAKCYNLLSI